MVLRQCEGDIHLLISLSAVITCLLGEDCMKVKNVSKTNILNTNSTNSTVGKNSHLVECPLLYPIYLFIYYCIIKIVDRK